MKMRERERERERERKSERVAFNLPPAARYIVSRGVVIGTGLVTCFV